MPNSSAPHVIRLRKPWQKTVDGSEASARIDVPESLADVSLATATYVRRFNRPSGLAPDTQVQLRIESWQGELVSLAVNDTQLVASGMPCVLNITSVISPSNTITIKIAADRETPPCLNGEVTLAIIEQ